MGSVFFYKYSEVTEKWGIVNGSIYNENQIMPGGWSGTGKQNANALFGYSVDMDVSSNWCIIGIPQTNAGWEVWHKYMRMLMELGLIENN